LSMHGRSINTKKSNDATAMETKDIMVRAGALLKKRPTKEITG
jgi:hypothetical protein